MFRSLDDLIQFYRNAKEYNLSLNSPESLCPIKKWLRYELEIENGKSNEKSADLRRRGNTHFKEKNLRKSIEFYNLSICCAQETSEEYFLAVANRSAVNFELGRFEDSLKDIDSCLESIAYPEKLRRKIYCRKMLCLDRLGRCSAKKDILEESSTSSQEGIHKLLMSTDMYEIPPFVGGENTNFAYASSKIALKYDDVKKRHVVANQNIRKGDILFVEKAFAFGGIFDEHSRTFNMLKCSYCLKITYRGIPCEFCAKCIYCDSQCRNELWKQSHRWECKGMHGDIWYHLGIAFPAFRALLKGFNSNFQEIEQNNINFGNKEDNYPFFNSLVYDEFNKHLEVSIMTIIVSVYLKEYTNFFDWMQPQMLNVNHSNGDGIKFFEYQLCKHILQFQNNSSIIEHWLDDELLPSVKEPVACGIFPAVSMMNHSCRPNIANYFVCDTIVVKALVDIEQDEEINNCYGIYYRDMCRSERLKNCLQLYNFECKCVICSDSTKEMDVFDKFICPHCNSDVTAFDNTREKFLCKTCRKILDYQVEDNMLHTAEVLEDCNSIESLSQALDIKRKFLNRHHSSLQNTYLKLYHIHKEKDNMELALNYFEEWFRVEKEKIQDDIQLFSKLLYEISSHLLSKLDVTDAKNGRIILKAKKMMNEAMEICKLYYPSHIIDRINYQKS